MSRIIRFAKTIRRNWKKSIVGFSALGYGISYGIDKYKTFQIMRAYCEEAKKYGEMPQSQLKKPRHVTVILNPTAHGTKAKSLYEKHAAPLLHLAGLRVSIFQTENEGQAIDLMEIMGNTDAVIIAGGNGTLHEAVTGLLRRPEYEENSNKDIPIGIIPVGYSNTVSKVLFSSKTENTAQWLAEAAMAVIRESTVLLDVMRIEMGQEKPLFALCNFEIGAYPSIESNLSKYWYFGPLKARVAYFIASLKKKLSIDDIIVDYIPSCEGCSRCYLLPQRKKSENKQPKRWWSSFVPKTNTNQPVPEIDYSKIINEDCGIGHVEKPTFFNFNVSTGLKHAGSMPFSKALWINWQQDNIPFSQFFKSGMLYHKGASAEAVKTNSLPAKEIVLSFEEDEPKCQTCYIDSEKHSVQKTHLLLLPKHLTVYA